MNVSFWVIFLSLVLGAAVGFGFGKVMVTRQMRAALSGIAEKLKVATEQATENLKKIQTPVAQFQGVLTRLGVVGFDTRYYKIPGEKDIPDGFDRKSEIEDVSNLITTMTKKGALDSEIGRAVRYSMVVIDTEKLKLDWKQARNDEGIDFLYGKYMNKEHTTDERN